MSNEFLMLQQSPTQMSERKEKCGNFDKQPENMHRQRPGAANDNGDDDDDDQMTTARTCFRRCSHKLET